MSFALFSPRVLTCLMFVAICLFAFAPTTDAGIFKGRAAGACSSGSCSATATAAPHPSPQKVTDDTLITDLKRSTSASTTRSVTGTRSTTDDNAVHRVGLFGRVPIFMRR